MSDKDFATKGELTSLKKEMYAGFDKMSNSISMLSESTATNFKELTSSMNGFVAKSMNGDYNVKNDILKEFETREREKRQNGLKLIGIGITLLMALWSAIWWGINKNEDKKHGDSKIEEIQRFHELEKRLLILELEK